MQGVLQPLSPLVRVGGLTSPWPPLQVPLREGEGSAW